MQELTRSEKSFNIALLLFCKLFILIFFDQQIPTIDRTTSFNHIGNIAYGLVSATNENIRCVHQIRIDILCFLESLPSINSSGRIIGRNAEPNNHAMNMSF